MKKLQIIALAFASLMTWTVGASEVRYLDFTEVERAVGPEKYDSPFQDDPYFKINSIEVTEIPVDEAELLYTEAKEEKNLSSQKNLGQIIMTIDKLIALGTKIYDIVKKGKPVVNMNFAKPVSVLPNGESPQTAFAQMSNWSAPTRRKYRVEYKNGWGSKVISFDYSVYFQHSGRYEGKGQYLTGVTVRASNVAVSWGFEFNASSELETISNRGSMDDPMAAATLRINYRASSLIRDIQSSESFHVAGNGEIVKF